MDAARVAILDAKHALFAMKTGMLYVLTLHTHWTGYALDWIIVFGGNP